MYLQLLDLVSLHLLETNEIIKWLFESGFHIGDFMTIGPYQESQIPFLPSLVY